ncbi:type IV pilin protein [Caenimonas terrae]|uniref:Type IV pilin protein n=1 Tax=Caenimonas terrae TaxID=696074 RepID=A0ABW0N9N5_9BURK
MKHVEGFTLIELMVTVAVVGILAAVALPAYTSYSNRGKITDALAALGDYRVKMEQYFQDNRNYGTASTACPVSVAASSYFTYSCTVGSTTPTVSFTATATSIAGAVGRTAGDYVYTINEANAKATTSFKGAAVTKTCWVIRGSEC